MVESAEAARAVRELWCRQLDLPSVDDDTDFFLSGGHSLAAATVVSRVRAATGRDVRLKDLFDARTFKNFLTRVSQAPVLDAAREPLPTRVDRSAPVRVSLEQERVLRLLEYSPTTLAVHFALRIRGPLDTDRLQAALDQVSRRHELLRVTFEPDAAGRMHQRDHADARLTLRRVAVAGPDDVPAVVTEEVGRPIDRAAAPLARCTLVEVSPTDHTLVFVLDHIITDGQSIGILMEDLGAAYEALGADPAAALPPQAYDFADWAHWQRELLDERRSAELVAYWRDRLGPDPSVVAIELPGWSTPTAAGAATGSSARLGPEETGRLRAAAANLNVTRFSLLLAGLLTAMSRRTGQTSFCVGTALGNRTHAAFERVFGPLSHDVYIRVDLPADPAPESVAPVVQAAVEASISHGDLPSTVLWERVWPGADEEVVNAPALFFVLNQEWAGGLRLPGTTIEGFPTAPQTPMPGLECTAYENPERLSLHFSYLAGSLPDSLVAELTAEAMSWLGLSAVPLD